MPLPKMLGEILKLTVALLKHQAKLWLGENAVGIIGENLIEIGDEDLQKRIEEFIATDIGGRELIKIIRLADSDFQLQCKDHELRQAFTLSFGDLDSVQKALVELPHAMDTASIEIVLSEVLSRDFPNLDSIQIELGAKLYSQSLQNALMKLKEFTLPIVGQVVAQIRQTQIAQNELLYEILLRIKTGDIKEHDARTLQHALNHNDIRIGDGLENSIFIVGSGNHVTLNAPQRQQFFEMVTAPGILPAGSYLPFRQNKFFTGRKMNLGKLKESLVIPVNEGNRAEFRISVLTGMGGIGKTQLAVEFSYLCGYQFKGVHWLDMNNLGGVDAAIAHCGKVMGLPNIDQTQLSVITLQKWMEDGPRLLILDNFEDVDEANEIINRFQHPSLRLLITSRRRDWPRTDVDIQQHELKLFSDFQSLSFMKKTLKKDYSDREIKLLAQKLGNLPLALELAANYLKVTKAKIGDYRKELSHILATKHESMHYEFFKKLDISNPTKHNPSLLATFELSWNYVNSPCEQYIFKAIGYCAPNTPIPLEILDGLNDIDSKTINIALYRLDALGLINLIGDLPKIHPLLADYAQYLDAQTLVLSSLAKHLEKLANERDYEVDKTGDFSLYFPLLPHIRSIAEHAETAQITQAGSLWCSFGYFVYIALADYDVARDAFERALNFSRLVNSLDHVHEATIINNLGEILYKMKDILAAKVAFERAVELDEKNLGINHPNLARDINNLGEVLRALGDLLGAKNNCERARDIDVAYFGQNHHNVSRDLCNIGRILYDMGNFQMSVSIYMDALRIERKNFSLNHPRIGKVLVHLGMAHYGVGNKMKAGAAIKKGVKILKQSLPHDHPEVRSIDDTLLVINSNE